VADMLVNALNVDLHSSLVSCWCQIFTAT